MIMEAVSLKVQAQEAKFHQDAKEDAERSKWKTATKEAIFEALEGNG